MNIEQTKIKSISLGVTAVVAVLAVLFLFITFSFEIKEDKLPVIISLAMDDNVEITETSNFGNHTEGNTPVEPMPSAGEKQSSNDTETASKTQAKQNNPAKTKIASSVQKEIKAPVASSERAEKKQKASSSSDNKKTESKPQGDTRAKSALESILSGKGNQRSSGQGNGQGPGNVGDPKGNSSEGENIGENWKTRIPENESHQCSTGGVVIVDIVVDSQGKIKRATPRPSSSDCLVNTAKSLVYKYVTAYPAPGKENRRGSYRVNLK